MLLGSAGASGNLDVSTLTDRLRTEAAGYPYGTDKGGAAGNDAVDFATYAKDGTTGFEYAMNRYYSAGLGRFLSVDPYGGSGVTTDPGSWNRFSYAQGDPVNENDSRGLSGCAVDDASCNPALCLGDGVLGGPCNPPQFCWDDSYEYSGGVVPNVTCFGSGQSVNFSRRKQALSLQQRHEALETYHRTVADAMKMVKDALKSADCRSIFGSGEDPYTVLNDVVSGQGDYANYELTFGLPDSNQMVTFGEVFKLPLMKASFSINVVGWAAEVDAGSNVFNAETLLQELGHLFSVLGHGSQVKNDSLLNDSSNEAYNNWLIDQNCFGGQLGFPKP